LPLFWAKKEVFDWIMAGKKTIDVRKGKAFRGKIAVFQYGNQYLRPRILQKQTGRLTEILRQDNYKLIVPSAESVNDAMKYLIEIYKTSEGDFTAYYLEPKKA